MIICKNLKIILAFILIIFFISGSSFYGCKNIRKPGTVDAELIKMELVGIRVEATTLIPVILLKEKEGERYLPIWIGMSEAYSIALELTGTEYIRPLTHDLIVTVIDDLGAKVEYIVVNDLKDDIFYANIHLRKFLIVNSVIDSRPSDAISIALRSGCEIYAAPHVLDNAGIELETPEKEFKEL